MSRDDVGGRRVRDMNFSVPPEPRKGPLSTIEQVVAAMHAADVAAREKLPPLPEGYEWHADLDIAQGVGDFGADPVTARLTYRVRQVLP